MRIAYLDCFAGVAGDMMLGALVDAGVPRSVLVEATEAMGLEASLQFESVDRSGITAVKVHVLDGGRAADGAPRTQPEVQRTAEPLTQQVQTQHQHRGGHPSASSFSQESDGDTSTEEDAEEHGRSLTHIREMIVATSLADDVKRLAIRTFELLGTSEAKIHNVPVDEIHFHEVGAVDAIVDIVASAAGIVHLGVDRWYCSPVNVGSGTVRCAHGLFPVPAPATADLLRGLPTYSAHLQKELTTPTGAALLRAIAPDFGPQPAMQVQQIGYGAGTRNPPAFPNVLRLSVGEAVNITETAQRVGLSSNAGGSETKSEAGESVAVVETALDDASPQLLAYVTEQALAGGALDAMLTPVIMKKGRPGTLVTLLCKAEDALRFQQMLLRETTTLGVRTRMERRACLQRTHVEVDTEFGSVRVKVGFTGDETLNVNPEYEDCRRLAEAQQVPLKQVHAAALAAYLNRQANQGVIR